MSYRKEDSVGILRQFVSQNFLTQIPPNTYKRPTEESKSSQRKGTDIKNPDPFRAKAENYCINIRKEEDEMKEKCIKLTSQPSCHTENAKQISNICS